MHLEKIMKLGNKCCRRKEKGEKERKESKKKEGGVVG
jgi:hypothetical protein